MGFAGSAMHRDGERARRPWSFNVSFAGKDGAGGGGAVPCTSVCPLSLSFTRESRTDNCCAVAGDPC